MTRRAAIAVVWLAVFAGAVWVAPDPHSTAAAAPQLVNAQSSSELVQGKSVGWWARHAVQARKDANARARTIRVLRASLRGSVDYEPRRGLASASAGGLTRAFLCIHGFEGAWSSDTGNGYHGGIQMDGRFERTYGAEFLRAWGDAENWPAYVQLAVGMRAFLSGRGFAPWPNTAHACGLR